MGGQWESAETWLLRTAGQSVLDHTGNLKAVQKRECAWQESNLRNVPARVGRCRLMPRRTRPKRPAYRCGRWRLLREPWEDWRGGLCPTCSDQRHGARRRKAGARILARSTEVGVEERDGELYRIIALPPTRRRGRRR